MVEQLNTWGKKRQPFFALWGYSDSCQDAFLVDECARHGVFYDFQGKSNVTLPLSFHQPSILTKKPVSIERYKKAFKYVQNSMHQGDTYLLNLTFPTSIELNGSLWDIFCSTQADYKILYKDEFVCFSPEPFIHIKDTKLSTFPMKGTIDATIENAQEKILANEKEMNEHTMVVDLLRNDISQICTNVRVERFRYIQKLQTISPPLLQVSSHISGKIEKNWHNHIGTLLAKLLPAGSISGTPKKKSCEIIKNVEGYERGFYSGIGILYDGETLISCVLIRFIEKHDGMYWYKSGGGITHQSNMLEEYEEMVQKVYVPII